MNIFYEDEMSRLILSDVFKALADIPNESIDMVFADPPYFLSSDGMSCSG